MGDRVITPGPYRATKLWNEVTRLFRSGMPLRKHRHNFRVHAACFTATSAVDWLHQLLRSNSNFGPDVTRQQTVQLLKKFLKNHVIEDVKSRWGTEDLEDNNMLYRFPITSPLKQIPAPAAATGPLKRSFSFRDKEGLFRFRSVKKHDKETQENVDPTLQIQTEEVNQPMGEQQVQRRGLTEEDEQEIWKDITLTHLQKILGLACLDEVLDHRLLNPQNIIHNMTKVNKHGVVTLEDKTNDLPHWVLSAMKSLANWPKYDSGQPSYPGFERDVFKTVSDYFYSLPQPLLTYELYELFINVLVLCGYVAVPPRPQRGKRKLADPPSVPPPAKTSFRSTECLLLSLLRQGLCEEADSPINEVFGTKLCSLLKGSVAGHRFSIGDRSSGGSSLSLDQSKGLIGSTRPRPRSYSLETVLDDATPPTQRQLFLSNDSLASSSSLSRGKDTSNAAKTRDGSPDLSSICTATSSSFENASECTTRNRLSVASVAALSIKRSRPLRPKSAGSCLDIVMETREEVTKESKWHGRVTSCLNVNTPHETLCSSSSSSRLFLPLSSSSSSSHTSSSLPFPSLPSAPSAKVPGPHTAIGAFGSIRSSSTTSIATRPDAAAAAAVAAGSAQRCLSSQDLSKLSRPVALFKPPVCLPTSSSQGPQTNSENSLLQPQCERVAIEALQLCTLLLPPTSRRKLQLLMRMMSRISQNVDMPPLHHAIGTRTLVVHTFSSCVLGSAEECDLDELLATRLVSFLMDHQQDILSVPEYLLWAITDHVQYLRTAQLPAVSGCGFGDRDPGGIPVPIHAFCRQISSVEFEQQRVTSSQKAMEELLEILLTDQNISEKDRCKKLKQFQKQYPDIYRRRFPPADGEDKQDSKPKIKPALLNLKKTRAFSIRS
ncbi:DEP domain-containing protein 1A [Lampris incognitus]|uniref:DEP domain-containing protein 1A n=1 Tax=Lampris incognitus TaxID=2546036 RepID=UPI0024B57E63|nr:DEP domain-containing protein 1A [Lampris incognitus]